MSDTETDPTIVEEFNEAMKVDGEPTRDLQKKKPRSEKQIEALKKAQTKRAENIERRKQENKSGKLEEKRLKLQKELNELDYQENDYAEEEIELPKVVKSAKARRTAFKKPVKKTVVYESDSSDTDEEEIIIVKKRPRKTKKPPKQQVVYESTSESSEFSEEEYETTTKQLQRGKVHRDTVQEEQPVYHQSTRLRYSDVFKFA